MKTLIATFILLILVVSGNAQSFEGTITYTMTMKITDLNARRDIMEAQKEMNDPINKPKYDKLRENLKDPSFIKGLDTNPKLKSEVREMLSVINTASFEENLSGKIVVKLKDKRSSVQIETGVMDKQEILYQGDKGISYAVDHKKREYSLNDPKPEDSTRSIRKTSETATILGHVCTRYQVVDGADLSRKPTLTYVWTTTEIKDIDLAKSLGGSIGAGSPLVFNVGEGVPLKIQRMMSHGILTTECISIEKGILNASEFEIPPGYTETKP